MKLRYWYVVFFSYLYSCWIIGTWLLYITYPHEPIWAWRLILINYIMALILNSLTVWLSSEVLFIENS